jgi:hypothetical protein
MQKYADNVASAKTGRAIEKATVVVTKLDGSAAQIYSDNGTTLRPSMLTTDKNGYFEFYAPDGHYRLTISGPGIESIIRSDILLEDPADGNPFDLTSFYPGIPSASAKVTRVPVARTVSFPANLAGSIGIASVAATALTAFAVRKNAASVGTITFAAGATTATFTTASGAAFSLTAGDYLSIVAPATPDATLADVGFVLAGTR